MSGWLLTLASAEVWSRAGFWLLMIGLAGEFALIIISIRRHRLETRLAAFFTALVAVGVYVGHVGDDAIFERVSRRALDLEQELKTYRQDRILNSTQRLSVTNATRKFPGLTFDAGVANNDPEYTKLVDHIAAALIAAGWTHVSWQGAAPTINPLDGSQRLGRVPVVGVVIEVHPNQRPELFEAAKELSSVLTSEKIEATANVGVTAGAANANAIHVMVGRRR